MLHVCLTYVALSDFDLRPVENVHLQGGPLESFNVDIGELTALASFEKLTCRAEAPEVAPILLQSFRIQQGRVKLIASFKDDACFC